MRRLPLSLYHLNHQYYLPLHMIMYAIISISYTKSCDITLDNNQCPQAVSHCCEGVAGEVIVGAGGGQWWCPAGRHQDGKLYLSSTSPYPLPPPPPAYHPVVTHLTESLHSPPPNTTQLSLLPSTLFVPNIVNTLLSSIAIEYIAVQDPLCFACESDDVPILTGWPQPARCWTLLTSMAPIPGRRGRTAGLSWRPPTLVL